MRVLASPLVQCNNPPSLVPLPTQLPPLSLIGPQLVNRYYYAPTVSHNPHHTLAEMPDVLGMPPPPLISPSPELPGLISPPLTRSTHTPLDILPHLNTAPSVLLIGVVWPGAGIFREPGNL